MGRCSFYIGVAIHLLIFESSGVDVKSPLKTVIAVTMGDEFYVICIEEAVY